MDVQTLESHKLLDGVSESEVRRVLPASDGKHFVVHMLEDSPLLGSLHIVNSETRAVWRLPGGYPSHDPRFEWVRWSPSGRYLIAYPGRGNNVGGTWLFDTKEGNQLYYPLRAHFEMAFSSDESFLVLRDQYYNLEGDSSYLLDLETQELHEFDTTRFLGWRDGEQDSMFFCAVG